MQSNIYYWSTRRYTCSWSRCNEQRFAHDEITLIVLLSDLVEGIIDETDDVKEKLKPVVSSDRSQSPLLDRASSPHFVRKKDVRF